MQLCNFSCDGTSSRGPRTRRNKKAYSRCFHLIIVVSVNGDVCSLLLVAGGAG